MSDDGSSNPMNPFGGIPFFADMMRAMAARGPLNWDRATQFATLGARGDDPDPEPSPGSRIEWNSLADIADLRVREATGLSTGPGGRHLEILTVTRAGWAQRTLADLRPLFNDLATSLARPVTGSGDQDTDDPDAGDPFAAMLGQISKMLAPAMMGMSIGSMAGALARHALGQYDLPLARPNAREILVVDSTVETFADDWSIPRADLRMWVLVHELASHAVLSSPAAGAMMSSISDHVAAFRPDPSALMERMESISPDDPNDVMSSIQSMFSDPMVLLGAVRSSEQDSIAPLLDARVAAIQGYIDWVVDTAGAQVLGATGTIAEAVRRRRLEFGSDARLIEGLLGLTLNRTQMQRGRSFVEGVIERDGATQLGRMLTDPALLPTPNEVDAPGLWLARLEVL